MKNLILILFVVFLSCNNKMIGEKSTKSNLEQEIDIKAKVSKIDSIADYYLVFIENGKQYFKIVSIKNAEIPSNNNKIEINGTYNFKIKQITYRNNVVANNQNKPVNLLDITRCLNFNKAEICTESAYELAKSSNLKGLNLLLEPKK